MFVLGLEGIWNHGVVSSILAGQEYFGLVLDGLRGSLINCYTWIIPMRPDKRIVPRTNKQSRHPVKVEITGAAPAGTELLGIEVGRP